MSDIDLKQILEGALFASREPMSIYQMKKLLVIKKHRPRGCCVKCLQALRMIIKVEPYL